MPKSKTRRKPSGPPRPDTPPRMPGNTLTSATLTLTEASIQLVRAGEEALGAAVRAGDDAATAEAIEVHRYLRTASLALLVAYSKLSGNPDPRDPEVLARVHTE